MLQFGFRRVEINILYKYLFRTSEQKIEIAENAFGVLFAVFRVLGKPAL
jgi:hypothetical protein